MASLRYIKCKGSYGVWYGLGLDEIAVNFENVHGLINLAGNNGTSKTTFMEMLSPFPVFPSRQQKNPQKYNFKKQFRLRDSYKEVCYLHQGKKYVFRVEIPAGTTMSPEGYIHCDGVPMVKGKISEYKRVVSELFGSEKLFYSSIFSCQGGTKLTDLTVGDFKNLLIELLGLKKYNEYWHNTGAVIKECDAALAEVLRDLEIYSAREQEIGENQTALALANNSLDEKLIEIKSLEFAIAGIRQKIGALQKEFSASEKQEAIVQEKNKQLLALTDEIVKLRASATEITRKHTEYVEEYEARTKPWRELLEQKDQILTASERIEQLKTEELSGKEKLHGIAELGSSLKEKISGIDLELAKHEKDKEALVFDRRLLELKQDLSFLEKENGTIGTEQEKLSEKLSLLKSDHVTRALEKELAVFESAEKLLTKRPEGCRIDDCPFIKNALDQIALKPAKLEQIEKSRGLNISEIISKEEELSALAERLAFLSGQIKDTSAFILTRESELRAIADKIESEITALQTSRAVSEQEKSILAEEYKLLSQRIQQLPAGIGALETLAGKKADLETAKKLLEQSAREFGQKKDDFIALVDGEIQGKIAGIEQQAEVIKNEILALAPAKGRADIQTDIDLTNQALAHAEIRLKNSTREASDIEKTIAVLEDKIRLSEKDAEEITRLRSRETFIREELSKWSYIRDAVSKSGLQALEISAAAPLLTSIANDLLHAAYGGEFFLDLVTQDPETGAEILDIMITRGDGQTYSLCDFSGGESVWVLQAFKAAQILVNAEKSGVHFATCFADEESGALDKEKAERFIQMYRALMVQGNFEKLFFISHIPECQAMADHSLVFQKGGIVSESDIGMVA